MTTQDVFINPNNVYPVSKAKIDMLLREHNYMFKHDTHENEPINVVMMQSKILRVNERMLTNHSPIVVVCTAHGCSYWTTYEDFKIHKRCDKCMDQLREEWGKANKDETMNLVWKS